jgi:hypothetical protein
MRMNVQQGRAIQAPRTRAELDALMARRGELRSQLRSSEERRFMLSEQASHAPPDGRATMNQRIATLDARIAQIESQLLQLDEAISTGLANPNLIHSPDRAVAAPAPTPRPSPEAVVLVSPPGTAIPITPRMLLAGGLVTLSLLALLGWLAWRRAVATLTRNLRASTAGQPDMNQLQQSVDAIAVEVERISENQRYVTKLLNQQAPGLALGGAGNSELERMPVEQVKRREK